MHEKVLIIGGGFAGISLAKGLSNTHFQVQILDKKNHHLFQPLLYQVASASLSPADISVPIREIFRGVKNISVHMQEVEKINKDTKHVTCKNGEEYSYDYLVIATGSRPFFYNNKDFKENAKGLKTIKDALEIRDSILSSFEKKEVNEDKELNIVIVGAGPTGVELAGAFAEVAYQTLKNEYRDFNPMNTQIYLIEGGQNVLASYSESISKKARSLLEDLGVKVLTGQRVEEITSSYIKTTDHQIKTNNVIWAAGNKVSALVKSLDTLQDQLGRAKVTKYLNLESNPEIFVLGDAACVMNKKNEPLPSVAPVANQQGKYLAKYLLKKTNTGFEYLDKGSMATIGKYKAVMEWKNMKASGFFAWLAWGVVHIFFLINFRNKVIVFIQWLWALLTNRRGSRLIK